jgi:hypothetical protein
MTLCRLWVVALGMAMGGQRSFKPSLFLGLVLLAICAGLSPTNAQERASTEIVPQIPHTSTTSPRLRLGAVGTVCESLGVQNLISDPGFERNSANHHPSSIVSRS